MVFVNIYKQRRDERVRKLPLEIQIELKKFENMSSDDFQFHKISSDSKKPNKGDVFIFSPRKNLYFYGRVLEADIKSKLSKFFNHTNVIILFGQQSNSLSLKDFTIDYNSILGTPMIVSDDYWKKGYFYTVGNISITPEEEKLDYGFYKIHPRGNAFCTASGDLLNSEPKFLGLYAIATITGVSAEVHREFIMNPSLLTDKPLIRENGNVQYNYLFFDDETMSVILDLSHDVIQNISRLVEEQYKVYMNGYNWEIFLVNYWGELFPEILEKLEIDVEAANLIFKYDDEYSLSITYLCSNMVFLIQNPEIILSFINNNKERIVWD